ncbi:MAG: cadherin domain-containing protein, partial [Cyclobacteriaceae bacterium]
DDVDFKIDQNTGMLTFVIVPDFESPQDDNSDNTYILKVAASDGVNSTDQTITIIVTEVNENPIIQSETLTIDENSSYGFVVGTILATDPDGDALNFEIESGNTDNAFSLNNSNGVLTVNNSAALDYETAPFFDLLVTVNDGRGGIAATIIVVQLDDLNETVTGIFDNVQNDNLKLFPNPVGDSFRFSDRGLKIREVLLYKLDGSLIRQFNGVQSHYDVRNLKAGTYLIRVNSEGKNYFQRLLKN